MATFDKREKGYESKFAHDQEMAFKVQARRNKLLGLWAAEKLGLVADDADSYAKQVVIADFEAPGDDDVFVRMGPLAAPRLARSLRAPRKYPAFPEFRAV